MTGETSGGITSQDAIVDILGVLVTILMGWNIISLVDFKKKADEIDYIKQDFKNVISGFMQLIFDSSLMIGSMPKLLDNCFKALDEIHTCLNDNIREMAERKLMEQIKQVCDEMVKNNSELIYSGKRNAYLHILSHIDSEYTKDIEEFIQNAREDEQRYVQNVHGDSPKGASLEIISGKRD